VAIIAPKCAPRTFERTKTYKFYNSTAHDFATQIAVNPQPDGLRKAATTVTVISPFYDAGLPVE
jgi:hypothetical protein